ncbi:MAG TPA: lytic transglycosylase domain-containing protein [Crinalium sp.]
MPVLVGSVVMSGLVLPLAAPAAQAQVSDQQQWVTSPDAVIALRRAIIGQESSANFRAVNPHSGALGYGQVMPANLASWSLEALGYSVSRADFLNSPEIQIMVIDHKLNQYWQDALIATGGDEGTAVMQVASRWYSGSPYRYTSNRPQYYRGHRYPSIAEYSSSVLQRYQQQWVLVTNSSQDAQLVNVSTAE